MPAYQMVPLLVDRKLAQGPGEHPLELGQAPALDSVLDPEQVIEIPWGLEQRVEQQEGSGTQPRVGLQKAFELGL